MERPIRQLMYGFGDVVNPAPDCIDMMEEMVLDFMRELCMAVAKTSATSRVKTVDILFALRNDTKKLSRAKELIAMEKELKDARSMLDGNVLKDAEAMMAKEEEVKAPPSSSN